MITAPGAYRTRDGRQFIVESIDKKSIRPVVGHYQGGMGTVRLPINGQIVPSVYSDDDVIGPWVEAQKLSRRGRAEFWAIARADGKLFEKIGKLKDAVSLAEELASENPNETFYVLKVTNEYTASVTVNIKEAE